MKGKGRDKKGGEGMEEGKRGGEGREDKGGQRRAFW